MPKDHGEIKRYRAETGIKVATMLQAARYKRMKDVVSTPRKAEK